MCVLYLCFCSVLSNPSRMYSCCIAVLPSSLYGPVLKIRLCVYLALKCIDVFSGKGIWASLNGVGFIGDL